MVQSDEAVDECVIYSCLACQHVVQMRITTSAKVRAEQSIDGVGGRRIKVNNGVRERLSLTPGLLLPVLVVMVMMRLAANERIVRCAEAEGCTDVIS